MRRGGIFLVLLVLISFLVSSYSHSSESIEAREALEISKKNIIDMEKEGIPTNRVEEKYEEAKQLYDSQLSFEKLGRQADYGLVLQYSNEINNISSMAFKASDEFEIFNETYTDISKSTNLSEMNEEYLNIVNSYKEERFEDTIELVNKGYDRISEIEASQTTLNLFYLNTTKSIKSFFENYWLHLLIGVVVIISFLLIFKNAIKKIRIRRRHNYLMFKKDTLNNLIKKIQKDYFGSGNISKKEYHTKLKKFEDLIRDIDREIPLIKEEISKIKRKMGKKN